MIEDLRETQMEFNQLWIHHVVGGNELLSILTAYTGLPSMHQADCGVLEGGTHRLEMTDVECRMHSHGPWER